MKLGFTGTREGMTPAQRVAFHRFLTGKIITEFHHGGCVGADQEAAGLVSVRHDAAIVEHLGQPGTYFKRNREIVDVCDMLVGVSLTPHRLTSGGTWYTIDYAIKAGKPVHVIWPDGTSGEDHDEHFDWAAS